MTTPAGSGDRAVDPQRVGEVCLALADTLGENFEVPGFLHQFAAFCLELLNTDGAGVMLADPAGRLRLLASTDEITRRLELFELATNDGPCVAAYRSGDTITHPCIDPAKPRWHSFARSARTAGYRCAHAIPMRHGDQVIGVLNLFRRNNRPLSTQGQQLARTLADMATIGLLNRRAMTAHRTLAEQLQQAFTTRLIIEQAKGLLAGQLQVRPEHAFHRLRRHARNTNRNLTDLAQAVIDGTATLPKD